MYLRRLIYGDVGKVVISIILGLGLATLFRRFCDGKDCYTFIGPKQNAIRDQIFSFDSKNSKCYTMREQSVKCNSKPKTVKFA